MQLFHVLETHSECLAVTESALVAQDLASFNKMLVDSKNKWVMTKSFELAAAWTGKVVSPVSLSAKYCNVCPDCLVRIELEKQARLAKEKAKLKEEACPVLDR